jgi:myo-inositol-1(or 4)-monophosphatase
MALLKNKEPQVSIMYFPEFNEFHYAVKGKGYFVNGQKITLDQQKSLKESIVSFGDFSKSNPSSRNHQLKFIEQLMDEVLKTRIQGSSSIDFSFVASGKTQAHIIFSKNLWELKPGFLLVKEAGGIVHQYDGTAFGFEGQGYIVASNETILKGILKTLKKLK